MNDSIQALSEQIEQLVREHIASTRRAAGDAVERALTSSTTERSRSSVARRRDGTPGRRRGAEEIAALGEQLCAAVIAEPGATMAVLAPAVGATPRNLHRPMAALKRSGRVRSVGERHQTRYYPTSAGR